MNSFDVIVIGGGASGLMAAYHAAKERSTVLLIEKNNELGKKLSITGGGRCNIWNENPNTQDLLSHYGESKNSLHSAFNIFGMTESKNFFNHHGVISQVEDRFRAFPKNSSALEVRDLLVNILNSKNITIKRGVTATKIENKNNLFTVTTSHQVFTSTSLILSTGGYSHPETGSTGDGFRFAESLGHSITKPTSGLAPIRTVTDDYFACSGTSLLECDISLYVDRKRVYKSPKINRANNKVLFTHDGLSGPAIINLSAIISILLDEGDVSISMNPFVEDEHSLQQSLQRLFDQNQNKSLKGICDLLPNSKLLIQACCKVFDQTRKVNTISKSERLKLAHIFTHITLVVRDIKSETHSIVTNGGINLSEIDTKTFMSKKCHNLFLTGDLVNISRPSGGYSLQLCWTTGAIAGQASSLLSDTQI